jgi:membrane associated rhomboid family serine protease
VLPLKDNIPTDRFALVTVAFIAINVLVFLFWQGPSGLSGVSETKVVTYGAIPYEVTHPGEHCALDRAREGGVACGPQVADSGSTWLTLLTSMFMHGGFLHLAGNMLFLWIFGNNVEDSMGRGRFVAFYLLGGVAALAGQIAIDPNSTAPTIGASGAVAAVLGGYLLLYPRARVLTVVFIIIFVTIIEVPAIFILGFWFLQQIYFGAAQLSDPLGGGGVAYWAHIGGFVFGLVLIRAFARRVKRIPPRWPAYR